MEASVVLSKELVLGTSRIMAKVLSECTLYAPLQDPLLLLGEPGTGKTLLARELHDMSRRPGPFVAFGAPDLQDSLAQATLYGHSRGAFTGAHEARTGLLEAANGGTAFLDELGEATPQVQGMLLRLLDDGMIRRVGETRDRPLNVRFVMGTNADLNVEVTAGRFRQDLLDRFGYGVIRLPPLRERAEDIRPLAMHFFNLESPDTEPPCGIEPGVWEMLECCSWPGNVRQLALACRYAVVHAGGGLLRPGHLPPTLLHAANLRQRAPRDRRAWVDRRSEVLRVLSSVKGNKTQAARVLQISRPHLYTVLGKIAKPSNSVSCKTTRVNN